MEKFRAFDGKSIYFQKWEPRGDAAALVQIVHGMAEHSGCYNELAEFLVRHGYAVYCLDQRGHGKTAENQGDYGFIAEENGWELLLADQKQFSDEIINNKRRLPHFIYGHSMGSVVTQTYLQKWGNSIDGVLLSGVPYQHELMLKLGELIACHEIKKLGGRNRSRRLSAMTFGAYNKKFKKRSTAYDWLSRDEGKVQDYIADKRCGGTFTSAFFKDLLGGMRLANQPGKLTGIEHDLSFLFLTGEDDAVNNGGKGVWKRIDYYERHGFYDVEAVFYPQCRHDLKLELNREVIFTDMVTWLNRKVKDWHKD